MIEQTQASCPEYRPLYNNSEIAKSSTKDDVYDNNNDLEISSLSNSSSKRWKRLCRATGVKVWDNDIPEVVDNDESPFDIMFNKEWDNRYKLIGKIKELDIPYSEKLYKRILFLNEAVEEEYPNEKLITVNSIEGFLKFLDIYKELRYPEITITPNGNIRIQWQDTSRQHMGIEFISESEIKYVIFVPDPKIHAKTARMAGKVSINSFKLVVKPFQLMEFFSL